MVRVPAGSVPVAERCRNLVTPPRSVLVTGAMTALPTEAPDALRNVAVIPTRSFCPAYPPSQPDRLNGTPPASIAEAAERHIDVLHQVRVPGRPAGEELAAAVRTSPACFASG